MSSFQTCPSCLAPTEHGELGFTPEGEEYWCKTCNNHWIKLTVKAVISPDLETLAHQEFPTPLYNAPLLFLSRSEAILEFPQTPPKPS